MQRLFTTFILTLIVSLTFGQINNIRAVEKDTLVIINYDLISDNPSGFFVKIYLGDAENSFDANPMLSVTGDVGNNVSAGSNKEIIWNPLKSKDSLVGEFRFKIIATPIAEFSVNQCDIEISIDDIKTIEDKLLIGLSLKNHGDEFQSYFGGKIFLKSTDGHEVNYVAKNSFMAGKEGSNTIILKSNNQYNGTIAFDMSDVKPNKDYSLNFNLPNPCRENNFVLPINLKP